MTALVSSSFESGWREREREKKGKKKVESVKHSRLSSCQAEETDLITSSLAGPQPNGSLSWKQEVRSAGDSHPPSPPGTSGPDEPWMAAHTSGRSVTTYLQDGEREREREDFDFPSALSQFCRVTEKYST